MALTTGKSAMRLRVRQPVSLLPILRRAPRWPKHAYTPLRGQRRPLHGHGRTRARTHTHTHICLPACMHACICLNSRINEMRDVGDMMEKSTRKNNKQASMQASPLTCTCRRRSRAQVTPTMRFYRTAARYDGTPPLMRLATYFVVFIFISMRRAPWGGTNRRENDVCMCMCVG